MARVRAQRPGLEGLAGKGTPQAAPACPEKQPSHGQGAQLVKGHPPTPWYCCPLQTPGPSWCQQLSELSCAQAAGGRPVKGPCPPSPLGIPLIRRNVCVCAFHSFKGKKLSLGRIFSWDPRYWLLVQDPRKVGPPGPWPPLKHLWNHPLTWEGSEGPGYGWAGESASTGFRPHL